MGLFFPVKHRWREMASAELIEKSASELADLAEAHPMDTFYLPVPGIGFGGLSRGAVQPILDEWLDHLDNVVLVERGEEVAGRYVDSFRGGSHDDARARLR